MTAPTLSDTMVLLTREGAGQAHRDLQLTVVAKWLEIAEANGTLPGVIAFYTEGVKLACEGSPVLDRLRAFESRGVRLVVCKTCIDALGVADKVRVGVVGGMGDIVSAMAMARKVVTL